MLHKVKLCVSCVSEPLGALFGCRAPYSTIKPVELSYASYENTTSPAANSVPPLLINHGLFGSKSNWNSLCKVYHQKTNPQRKVIAIDARNHGDSPHTAEHSYEHLIMDLKQLIVHLRLQKVTLLGHSMGGRACMYFALKYPQLVDKLIIADISPVTTSPNLKTMPTLFSAIQSIELPKNVSMSAARTQADTQLAKHVSDRGLRAFLLTNLVQKLDGTYVWRINIPSLISNFNEIATFPQINDWKFEGPVLFIGGGASDYIQKADHPHILKLFPKAEIQYIEGAGHWVHSEKPSEFLQITLEFLNRTP